MKTKRVLFLIWLSVYTCLGHLEQVVDELSTLSRVSNAIALQNALVARRLQMENIYADLYLYNDNTLINLLTTANSEQFVNGIGKLFGLLGGISPIADKDVLDMDGPLQFLNDMLVAKMDGSMQNFSATRLIEALQKKEGLRIPCNHSVFYVASLFVNSLSRNHAPVKLTERRDRRLFRDHIPAILDCFRTSLKYASFPKGNVFEELYKLHSTYALYSVLYEFNKQYKRLERLPKSIEKMFKEVQNLKELEIYNLTNLSRQLDNAETLRFDLSLSKKQEHLVTPAFGSVENMKKVSADLKSAWFREKVAHGKSTAALDAALAPFYNVTEEIERLEVEMKDFLSPDKRKTGFIIVEWAESLEKLGQLQPRINALRKEKHIINELDRCWKDSNTSKVDEQLFKQYTRQLYEPVEAFSAMTTVIDKIVQIPQSISVTKFEKFVKEVQEVFEDVHELDDQIKEYKHIESMEEMEEVFRRMRDVHYAWNDYLMKMNHLHNQSSAFKQDTFSLAAVVNESRMIEYARCLNDSSINNNTLKTVKDVQESLEGSLEVRQNRALVEKFFDQFGVVQKSFGRMRSALRAVEQPVLGRNFSLTNGLYLVSGTKVVSEMANVRAQRDTLEAVGRWSENVMDKIISSERVSSLYHFWSQPEQVIKQVLGGVEALEEKCADIKNSSIRTLGTVFQEAQKVPGIERYREVFQVVPEALKKDEGMQDFDEAIENSKQLSKLDLDFARYSKELEAASTSMNALSAYFDKVFGVESEADGSNRGLLVKHPTTIELILAFLAILIVLLLILLIVFSSTKRGRSRMKDTFLYYFPNQTVFEKRWRYSLFLDREDGENALLSAVRDNNTAKTLNAIRKGAYINAYNLYGNTALHVATENGFAEIVELLIRNGADRSLLNSKNVTAEQYDIVQTPRPENLMASVQIKGIFYKYITSTFRIRVPREFAPQEFRILMEKRTDEMLTNQFSQKFKGITFEEATPSTTHCVCKCTKDGILETDDVELLSLMFTGVIMVRDEWMSECLHNEKLIAEDTRYLIEHVRFKGLLYKNCVLRWSCAQAKAEMPYLLGVHVMFVTGKISDLQPYISLITSLGGTIIDQPPSRKLFNSGSHPYLHSHLGPAFILHDASRNVSSAWQTDDVFTVLSLDEFIVLLLKRVCRPVQAVDPPSQLASTNEL